jgi:hypothetical protein
MASVGARADRRLPRNVTIGCWLCGMMHLATYQQAMTQTRNDAGKTFHSYLREKTLTGVWPHRPSRLQHRLMPHLSYGMYQSIASLVFWVCMYDGRIALPYCL